MDMEEIKELVRLMVDNELSELDVSDGENKVKLKRGAGGEPVIVAAPASLAPAPAPVQADSAEPVTVEEEFIEIKSPMVGTFYDAADPDSEPYASVGSGVGADTVVCIVEAMKVMNEIKADCTGTIIEICVKNAQPVEYGQVLFKVKPA